MKSIILFLSYSLCLQFFSPSSSQNLETVVKIEVLDKEALDFGLSVEYKEIRKQIHVKSDKALRSITRIDSAGKKKAYNAIGSNLVVLHLNDFTPGEVHTLELEFLKDTRTVIAKIEVAEI